MHRPECRERNCRQSSRFREGRLFRDLPQRIDAGVTSFLANLAVPITVATVEAGLAVLSPPAIPCAFSGSFLWHGKLTFYSRNMYLSF